MGKRSIKANKNIYQICRENCEYTREKASEKMEFISADRIEKIESEKSLPHPDEILTMSECYKTPELCNYFCSHECPIGIKNVPEVKIKDLSQIILETIASLNSLEEQKNRLIEITVDGAITEDEYKDFNKIKEELNNISKAIASMHLWLQKSVLEGKIDKSLLD